MKGKGEIVIVIVLTIVAFIVGVIGIGVLIGVGEAANNGILAFAAVSFPFALLAGLFSWISPRAQWPVAIAISAPVSLISCAGSWSGGYLMLGALWTVALSCGSACLGAKLRRSIHPNPLT